MMVLLNDPDLMRRLRDNPSDIPAMVEEALRWDPPIQCTFRRATRDDTLGYGCRRGRHGRTALGGR